MKYLFNKVFVLLGFVTLFMPFGLSAQDGYADSLKAVIVSNLPASTKVNTFIELSSYYLETDFSLALDYVEKAKGLARRAKLGKGLGYAYKHAGNVYSYRYLSSEALNEYLKSLHIFDSLQDKRESANILNIIGALFFVEGDNASALENYLKSYVLSKDIGDELLTATCMKNIGAVYFGNPTTHELALEYYLPALEMSEKIKDNRAIGTISVNIGEIYLKRGDDILAQNYFIKALDNGKETEIESSALIGLAEVEKYRNHYQKALEFERKAFERAKANDNLIDATRALIKQAEVMVVTGDEIRAIEKYKNAMPIAIQIRAYSELKGIYSGLASLYLSVSRYDSASKYLELLSNHKDTLFEITSGKILSVQYLNFELAKKEAEIALLSSQNALEQAITNRQAVIKIFVISAVFLLIVLFLLFRRNIYMRKTNAIIDAERLRSEKLLLNILPASIAEELKDKGESEARDFEKVTVLFTDFKEFTQTSEKLTAKELVAEINACFKTFDAIVEKYKIEKIKTIGDAYMAAGGLQVPRHSEPIDVVRAALEMQTFLMERKKENEALGIPAFEMRVGIHTGPVVAGIVGVKKFQYDIWGDTVNTASRMESNGAVGKVNISETTYLLIKDTPGFHFESRGKLPVKGKGELDMYFVAEA